LDLFWYAKNKIEENEWYGEEPDHSLPHAKTSHDLSRIQPLTPGKTNHHHQEPQIEIDKKKKGQKHMVDCNKFTCFDTPCLAKWSIIWLDSRWEWMKMIEPMHGANLSAEEKSLIQL
jgi:hypothetical protein